MAIRSSTSRTDAVVPVFGLPCDGSRRAVRLLRRTRGVRLVNTPRHAAVLVVAGDIPDEMRKAVCRVHDQVPVPRGVVLWHCRQGADLFAKASAPDASREETPGRVIIDVYRALIGGKRPASPLFGPLDNPVAWKGKGDHGQGGKGMMGGRPYGRPMAMTGGDLRDGLQLGKTHFELGPFLPWMPPGLRLAVTLQGDVIQQLSLKAPKLTYPRDTADVFARALSEPVPLTQLESARARHHLQAVSDLLYLLELDGFGRQALELADRARAGHEQEVRRFERRLRRTGLLHWATRGIGRLPEGAVAGMGPLARAAGRREDARLDDPAYDDLDFTPPVQHSGDAAAICAQRLAEAAQALELAGRAAGRLREPGPLLEGPRGTMGNAQGHVWQALIENQAAGMAWDEFATFLVSLDLDVSGLPPADDYDHADQPQTE